MIQEGTMLLKTIMLFFLTAMLYGCSLFKDVFEENYSLSAVSSFPEDIDELKKYGFIARSV
jgi:hypothetical protein